MFIYCSTKVLPYVYKLTHKESGKFYFGSRFANKTPSSNDIGTHYFTSSKAIKPIFNEFEIEILAEFFDKVYAHEYEQKLIMENWDNLNLLNKNFIRNSHPVCYQDYNNPSRSKKISDANTGKKHDGSARKGKFSYFNVITKEKEWTTTNDPRIESGELVTNKPRNFGTDNSFFGKKHTKESMERMVKTRLQSGNGDYHHGKMTQERINKYKEAARSRMNNNNPMKDPEVLKKVSATRSSFLHWYTNYFLRKENADMIINRIKTLNYLPYDIIIKKLKLNKKQRHFVELIEKIKDGSLTHPKEVMPCALNK